MAVTPDKLQVGTSPEYLDTTLVDTGLAEGPVHREGVFIGDPEDPDARAAVGKVTNKGHALSVRLADGFQLDPFGRLRVSMPTTLFDSQQEYGLGTIDTWDIVANGNYGDPSSSGSVVDGGSLVGPRNENTRLTPITAGTSDGNYAVLQSKQYVRYIPGKGHFIVLTGIFASSASDTISVKVRSSTSGSPVEESYDQLTQWNFDKFDGTGPSGITLDFTKTQILLIDAQWLGVGRVRFGFEVGGIAYLAHEDTNANQIIVPYTQSFNLPVRMEARTDATGTTYRSGYFDAANGVFLQARSTTQGGTIQFNCVSVQSDGGLEARGFPRCTPRTVGSRSVSASTDLALISIRPKATFNGLNNRAHIDLSSFITKINGNGDCWVSLVRNPTLTNASWVSIGDHSVVEYDISATAISGGQSILGTFASGGTTANSSDPASLEGSGRVPLVLSKVDSLAVRQPILSLVVRGFSGSANVTARGRMNWFEQIL